MYTYFGFFNFFIALWVSHRKVAWVPHGGPHPFCVPRKGLKGMLSNLRIFAFLFGRRSYQLKVVFYIAVIFRSSFLCRIIGKCIIFNRHEILKSIVEEFFTGYRVYVFITCVCACAAVLVQGRLCKHPGRWFLCRLYVSIMFSICINIYKHI